ncbi:conserved Plasmodium protein, unknown function [Plasmodium relictum]|uniref:Uncharacterized protein n=1 Tax=Plasmodium relictum TaxID=85471 RepID=A0A1J1H7W2_PLARL|nr:conserved Plasmodium protein, unknown function [Plasmodium relictum]CRH00755.1 conserved Plasmodium protein, unknown function [Plasmodium relictum]
MYGDNENRKLEEKEKEKDINEVNDSNIIPFCIKNILESTLEENIHNEDFLTEKNKELNNFIENNIHINIYNDKENEKYIVCDDFEFNNINSECFLNYQNKNCPNIEILGEKNSSTNPHIKLFVKEKKNKKRKRNYININKLNFDFEKEDFASTSNDEIITIKHQNENINNNYINMENKIIRELIEPPPIPFNEKFRKYNKEISDLYTKSKNSDETLNIYLASQLLCLKEENTFVNANYFINEYFDNFIMKKLNIANSSDENIINQNKDLQELLKYLMSWYFSGFYSGKMSVLK